MNSPPQQLVGIFLFPDEETPDHENAITIDAEYLQKHPFQTNTSFYADLGNNTTSLTLSAIDEKDAESILPLFTTLRHLSLEKITILNDQFNGLPNDIQSLQLVDCKITTDVARDWFKSIGTSLLRVKISRCSHAVQLTKKGSFVDLLRYLPDNVRSLSVYDAICTSISIGKFPACLAYLHLDTPKEGSQRLIDMAAHCAPKITTLIMKIPVIDFRSTEELRKLKNLQHLRILNSVDFKTQSLLQQSLGHLKTLDVHCYSPPAKENLVLQLNDDCLLHVLSFLQNDNWLAMSQTHSRFNQLVSTFIYPREDIFIGSGSFKDFSEQERMDIFKSLQQHATSVKVTKQFLQELKLDRFEQLQTLSLCEFLPNYFYGEIPTGIKGLQLNIPTRADEEDEADYYNFAFWENPKRYKSDDSIEGSDSDQSEQKKYQFIKLFMLFGRLAPSLTSLSLSGDFEPRALSQLKNLREFKVEDWKGKDWKMTDFVGILRKNERHLERLEFVFNKFQKCSIFSKFPLCPLKRLKVLHLIGINCQIDLKHSDFPALEDLKMTFNHMLVNSTRSYLLSSISKFVQLKSLSVEGMLSAEQLFPLKNLESLDSYVNENELVAVLKQLPKLSKLEFAYDSLKFETELELSNFLIAEKRTLRFHEDLLVLP